ASIRTSSCRGRCARPKVPYRRDSRTSSFRSRNACCELIDRGVPNSRERFAGCGRDRHVVDDVFVALARERLDARAGDHERQIDADRVQMLDAARRVDRRTIVERMMQQMDRLTRDPSRMRERSWPEEASARLVLMLATEALGLFARQRQRTRPQITADR